MNKELKTKLVLASVLAGFSTLAGATTVMTTLQNAGLSPVQHEVVVSQAARNAIDAKVQQAVLGPGPLDERFLQITKGGGTFGESGPTFAQQGWKGQMRLP